MALKDVMETIVERAREEARKEERRARREAAAMMDLAKREASSERDERLDRAHAELAARIARERSSIQFSRSRERLVVQRELLDELKDRFAQELAGLGEEEHSSVLRSLLAAASKNFPGGTVSVCPRDHAAAEKVVRSFKGFALGGDTDCIGGMIVTAPDGETRLDLLYETIMEDVWRDRLPDVHRELFGCASPGTGGTVAEPAGQAGEPGIPAAAGRCPDGPGDDDEDDEEEEDWDEDGDDDGEEAQAIMSWDPE